jgi:hypothetical protein
MEAGARGTHHSRAPFVQRPKPNIRETLTVGVYKTLGHQAEFQLPLSPL